MDLFRHRAVEAIGHISFLALEHGQPRGGLRHPLHDQALDVRRLAPVLGIGLKDHLDPRLMAHKPVRPQPNGMILKPLVTHLLHIVLGDNPGCPGGW